MTDKESDMFEIKKGTKQGDPLSRLQVALRDDLPRWQKKKGMGICLGDCELDRLTNFRFADDVLLFATTQEQLQKIMCEFKHSTEKVGLKIHPWKTKILSNHSSSRRREVEIDNIKSGNINQRRKHQISWTNGYISATKDNRDQESNQGCLGDVLQIQARVDLKILLSSALASFIRHVDHPNDELRIRNMDTPKRTRKNDSVDAGQNAPPHHTNKKKIQKRRQKNEEEVEEGVRKPETEKDGEEEK